AVLLGHDRVAGGGRRAVGPEQELRLLLCDQLLRQLGRDVGLTRVVFVFELDPVLDALDVDPALLVDPLKPHVVALFGQGALLGRGAGDRQGTADEGALTSWGGGGPPPTSPAAGQGEHRGKAQDAGETGRSSHHVNTLFGWERAAESLSFQGRRHGAAEA